MCVWEREYERARLCVSEWSGDNVVCVCVVSHQKALAGQKMCVCVAVSASAGALHGETRYTHAHPLAAVGFGGEHDNQGSPFDQI